MLAENFLERELCEGLIELSRPLIKRSKVASGAKMRNEDLSVCSSQAFQKLSMLA
jgi:hypothetical protein